MIGYLFDTNTASVRAAQAVAADAVLVTTDKAFSRVPDPLRTENWDGTR